MIAPIRQGHKLTRRRALNHSISALPRSPTARTWLWALFVAAYSREREQLQRGTIGRRTAARARRPARRIRRCRRAVAGSGPRQFRTALILTADENAAEPDVVRALERQAAEYATAIGGSRPLTIPSAARSLWAWVASPRPPGETVSLPRPRAGIRVAMGTAIPGVTGPTNSGGLEPEQEQSRHRTPGLLSDRRVVLFSCPTGFAFVLTELSNLFSQFRRQIWSH